MFYFHGRCRVSRPLVLALRRVAVGLPEGGAHHEDPVAPGPPATPVTSGTWQKRPIPAEQSQTAALRPPGVGRRIRIVCCSPCVPHLDTRLRGQLSGVPGAQGAGAEGPGDRLGVWPEQPQVADPNLAQFHPFRAGVRATFGATAPTRLPGRVTVKVFNV